jgi:type I restriction enzyme S subunit
MKQGWEIKKLGNIAVVSSGNSAPQKKELFDNGTYPFIRTSDVGKIRKGFISSCVDYLNVEGIKGLKLYKKGTILFPKSGASTFLNHRVMMEIDGYVSSHLATIKGNDSITDDRYLLYFLTTIDARNLMQDIAYPSLKTSDISLIPIPLPPLPEQQRIVAILDEAFAAIAKAKANAEQNLKNAKELFESYLQGVFDNKGEGWEEKTLGESDLIEIIDGDRGKNYPTLKDFKDEGYCLFMNTKNVRPDGFLFNTTMFIDEAKDKAMGKGKLKRNDVVMTTRGTIGNLGVYNEEVEFDNIRINSGMLIFRPNLKLITSEYLFEILRSGIIKEQIRKQVTGAAQPQLPIKTLVNFVFPVPKSLKQQQNIVQKLDNLSTETKKLEAIYLQKINDLEELKKSVLQKAFSGELKTNKLETV